MLKCYIGFDRREEDCYEVAKYTLLKHASVPVCVTPIELERNEMWGLMRRPREYKDGQMYDVRSDAPMSTEFAISRFLTPLLAQRGFSLFVDCDVMFHADVAELFALADDRYAVQCVKHDPAIQATTGIKMDGQKQTVYPRKNWSSVMLFNSDHPANYGLSLALLNMRPGRDLHRFCWIEDSEIGELPGSWNWLVGETPKPADLKLAHLTLGGPWLPNWKGGEHDDEWKAALQALRSDAQRSTGDTTKVA